MIPPEVKDAAEQLGSTGVDVLETTVSIEDAILSTSSPNVDTSATP